MVEAELARLRGEPEDAHRTLMATLERDDLVTSPATDWMVLSVAARVQAERALAARDEGRAVPDDVFAHGEALRSEAGSLRVVGPTDGGYRALCWRRPRGCAVRARPPRGERRRSSGGRRTTPSRSPTPCSGTPRR